MNSFFIDFKLGSRKVVGLLAAFDADPEDIGVDFVTAESLIDPFKPNPAAV
jgi:hypothetical protein